MKIKEGFTLRQIVGTWIVMPTGSSAVDFNDILNLNESASLIWKMMENNVEKETLCRKLKQRRSRYQDSLN